MLAKSEVVTLIVGVVIVMLGDINTVVTGVKVAEVRVTEAVESSQQENH